MRLFYKEKLDERQLMIRGNIYYQALTLISGLLITNFYLKTFLKINWAHGEWDYLLILFIGLLWILIRFIMCDIYPLTKARYRFLFIFVGCYGFGLGGYNIYLVIIGQTSFISDNTLTNTGAFILFASVYACVFIVYLIKLLYTKYFIKGDE